MPLPYVKSPMNYTGGKYKILEHIIPFFPKDINKFVDLFAGGLNVSVNVEAKEIYANDQITYLIDLYNYFKKTNVEKILEKIQAQITKYQLSQSNSEGYLSLRNDYNESGDILDLFILTCYAFNHQIRFNSKHQFNTPFGKERSSFNESIKKNLVDFCQKIQEKNIKFSSNDFRAFDFSDYAKGDLVYCDPPYLITTGSYNDGKRGFQDWTEKEDSDLQNILDSLHEKGAAFAMSNVFVHKGQKNESLIEWSKKYNVKYIKKSYSNCSYHFKDRNTETVEVLITNFEIKEEQCLQTSLIL